MSYKSENSEEQMILRLPPQLADQVRKMLRTKQLNDEIEFEFDNDNRTAKFKVGKKKYDGYVVDLPCILESHKTLDKTSYYKSADIGQMLVIQDPKDPVPPPADFKSLNGITPASRDIQRRKWRKPPDPAQLREIENEINRLLKPAENETVEILNADDIDDLDELTNTTEIINELPKTEKLKINLKVAEDGNMEPLSPLPHITTSTSSSSNKKHRSDRKKPSSSNNNNNKEKDNTKEKKEAPREKKESTREKKETAPREKKEVKKERRKEKKEPVAEKEEAQENGEKKEKKKKKKKEKKEGEEDGAVPTTEKKKRSSSGKKKERRHKETPEAAVPTSPPSAGFPFTTITQPPPPLPQPVAFSSSLSSSISTPVKITTTPFNANPFSSSTSISAPPISAPQEGGKAALQTQHRKLQSEVDLLRLKVADATNKYNILPNAVLKARFQVKVDEVTIQYDQKSKELIEVEKQLSSLK